jgi:hypothetical protein
MINHLKIGSAILNPDYFWSTKCTKCSKAPTSPEVIHHDGEPTPPRRLKASTSPAGLPSFHFELSKPGLYSLRNFCGGGFRFDAQVCIRNGLIEVMELQGEGCARRGAAFCMEGLA